MTISQLIEQLERAKQELGDLNVVVHDYNYNDTRDVDKVEAITRQVFVDYRNQFNGEKVLNISTK